MIKELLGRDRGERAGVDLCAPGHGLCARALESDRDVGEARVMTPGRNDREAVAGREPDLAREGEARALADAAKVMVPIEAPFFRISRSASAVGAVPA
jgi:hypothetical protein